MYRQGLPFHVDGTLLRGNKYESKMFVCESIRSDMRDSKFILFVQTVLRILIEAWPGSFEIMVEIVKRLLTA